MISRRCHQNAGIGSHTRERVSKAQGDLPALAVREMQRRDFGRHHPSGRHSLIRPVICAVNKQNMSMGGSVFVPEIENRDASARRTRALASASAFGKFAVRASTRLGEPSSVSGPRDTPNGSLVVTNYKSARNNSLLDSGPERLLTLLPRREVALGAGRIIELLSYELAAFAQSHLSTESSADLLRKLRQESARPCGFRLDSANLEGWLLQTPLVSGAALHHLDRLFMWLCIGSCAAAPAITTADYGKHVRSLMSIKD